MRSLESIWDLPLHRMVLIEASAGTGKTWTIVALYIRLLLELEQSVQQILVVTFTKAACAELRDRIRHRLFEVLQAFEKGGRQTQQSLASGDFQSSIQPLTQPISVDLLNMDPWLQSLLRKYPGIAARQSAINQLKKALRDFDQAAIYTIHGFCQRLLNEFALETGTPLQLTLLEGGDGKAKGSGSSQLNSDWEGLSEDFWRQEINTILPAWQSWLTQQGMSPARWWQQIKKHLSHPQAKWLVPTCSADELRQTAENLERCWQEVSAFWGNESARIAMLENLLQSVTSGILHASQYRFLRALESSPQETVQATDTASLPRLAHIPAAAWYHQCNRWLANDFLDALAQELPSKLDKFAQTALKAATNKGKDTPEHSFFQEVEKLLVAWQRWNQVAQHYWFNLTYQLWQKGNVVLPAARQALGVFNFDDLLHRVAIALGVMPQPETNEGQLTQTTEEVEKFLLQLKGRYPIALIDEFQDTDVLQYAIFRKIFLEKRQHADSIDVSSCSLFLVGDPKQAIYAFRGGDIVTYWRAQQEAEEQWTLTTNYRSDPLLIEAFNGLFDAQRHWCPFVFKEIAYYPAQPRSAVDRRLVVESNLAPLQWLFLSGDLTRESAGERAAQRVAIEIGRLIRWEHEEAKMVPVLPLTGAAHTGFTSSGAAMSHKPYAYWSVGQNASASELLDDSAHYQAPSAGDCAVLVATHEQASQIALALSSKGIPWVRQGVESIYQTSEAYDLWIILQAIAAPDDGTMLRTALGTTLFGYSAEEVLALTKLTNNSETQRVWAALVRQFKQWQSYFYQDSFLVMFERWLIQAGIVSRLLVLPNGLRRLTNLRHLAELMHLHAQHETTLDGLVTWLGKILQDPLRAHQEGSLLRLESDAAAVQIVTIHASKGLQYPVVFCPFLWSDSPPNEEVVFAHDDEDVPTLDWTGQSPQLKQRARKEWFAERLRLLYVALTRAQYRCYVVWGAVRLPKLSKTVQAKKARSEKNISAKPTELSEFAEAEQNLGVGLHTTALAWLLHPPRGVLTNAGNESGGIASAKEVSDPLALLQEHLQHMHSDDIFADLTSLEQRFPQAMAIALVEPTIMDQARDGSWQDADHQGGVAEQEASERAAENGVVWQRGIEHFVVQADGQKRFNRPILKGFAIHSYTALSKAMSRYAEEIEEGRRQTVDLPDWANANEQEALNSTDIPSRPITVHQLPAGRRTGLAVHEILAQLSRAADFSKAQAKILGWTEAACRRYALSNQGVEVIQTQIETAYSVMLPALRKSLSRIPSSDRWAELNFTLSMPTITTSAWRAMLTDQTLELSDLERESWVDWSKDKALAAGYLVGSMDLVVRVDERFWIIDWKTNRLGEGVANYQQTALEIEMKRERYALQYLLYTVALHRRLQLHPGYSYQHHFGGVYYLFWRGLTLRSPQQNSANVQDKEPSGIWFAKPAKSLITRLDALFTK